jgi:hypothetical protein
VAMKCGGRWKGVVGMLSGLAIKLFLGGLWKKIMAAVGFCIEHWKIVVPMAIVAVVLWQWYSAEQDLQKVAHEYAQHLAADETASKVRDAENAAKDLRMKETVSDLRIEHGKQLTILERNINEAQTGKRTADRTIADLRGRLRDELETADISAGLSGLRDRSFWATESRGDGDTADPGQAIAEYVDNLEVGCAITTADYNSLYQRCETANRNYGPKP